MAWTCQLCPHTCALLAFSDVLSSFALFISLEKEKVGPISFWPWLAFSFSFLLLESWRWSPLQPPNCSWSRQAIIKHTMQVGPLQHGSNGLTVDESCPRTHFTSFLLRWVKAEMIWWYIIWDNGLRSYLTIHINGKCSPTGIYQYSPTLWGLYEPTFQ